MREILFRGKRVDNVEWVYGYICYLFDIDYTSQGYDDVPSRKYYIITNKQDFIEIYSDTIGQYTGLKDKNGVKIFEGDLVRFENEKEIIVEWREKTNNCGCCSQIVAYGFYTESEDDRGFYHFEEGEVIGNIHDK